MKPKIKWTPQRLAIIKYLEGNKQHPSAEEIYASLSKDFPTMSVATVYNVLEFLKRTNRVKEIYIDPEKRRFDPDTTAHHHAICVKCKKVFDIYKEIEISDLSQYLPQFEILDSQLTIYVLCSKCKEKREIKVGLKEYKCSQCGSIRTAKHKPQKCPSCGSRGTLEEFKN
ncbi:fur family transcriptional regulator, peroxide stress response regulator [Thermodesulfovibrio aggregans]|uniref:Fur family transcriptional regulator, peroxide stress response regulator n=1 Tax=Thermodesulfovibrio aggregans TaxID=86166 RepID=A0A0U9HWZ2_9BACT|nr:transcriptional repressor [Thermodesulfovibrio aggregans]GAQ94197.1 fur family transcriptional regulator, peroxide stress response regulator [Thermodesulfovibrio aggregans]